MSWFQYNTRQKNTSLFSLKYLGIRQAEKNIGTACLEKDVNQIFFIVRLLPSLEMDLCDFDTYCKMTTFLSATNSKRKKRLCEDFIFKAIISSISIPLSQPLNTWRDSKVQFRPNYLKSDVKKDWTFIFRDIQSGVYTKNQVKNSRNTQSGEIEKLDITYTTII